MVIEFEFDDNNDVATDLDEVVAQLPDEKATELEQELGSLESTGELKVNLRGTSTFTIGDYVRVKKLDFNAAELTDDMKEELADADLYAVKMVCSFQAAEGCRFHRADFGIELQSEPSAPPAVAIELRPDKTQDEYKVSKKISFDLSSIKFKMLGVEAGIPIKAEIGREQTGHANRVTAHRLFTAQPGWTFRRTGSHEVDGSYELLMFVRKPKGSKVSGKLSLNVEQEFLFGGGPLGVFPLTTIWRKKGQIVDEGVIQLA
jgi:hypothetical protein